MIIDIADLPETAALEADVCIVGAGAAGISLALELAATSASVVVLESGGLAPETDTQALYAGSVADERLHSPPDRYRQRRFGGTTTIWGGRCMPFDPIDFERRDYVPDSGWPIGFEDLAPHYPAANRLCEAGRFEYSAARAFGGGLRPLIERFEAANFDLDTLERFSCPTDFGARYRRRITEARSLRVVLHANLTRLRMNEAGDAVVEAHARSLGGRTLVVAARRFVVAAGGLETARLLLANRDRRPAGIGNDHDVVGRYYMCHLAGTIGRLRIDGPPGSVHHGYDVSPEGIYCRRRLALRPESQRRLETGNFIARLHHPRITDPSHRNSILSALYLAKFLIPYEYGKRLHGEERVTALDRLRHVRNVALHPSDAVAFAAHLLRDRYLAARKFPSIVIPSRANVFSLDFHAEQFPNAASRVTLETETDALGMPRLRIDWRYVPGDVETVSRALRQLQADVAASGRGELQFDPASVEREMTRYGAYGGHHLGTARMGSDRRRSVVDRDCRVHGVDNLYVAGSAVFPTSSQANPTLTVVALALRLAAHLRGALARPVPSAGSAP